RYINQSSADVVCLQHEFGIYDNIYAAEATGTKAKGRRFFLLDMLERIEKPIVTTLHTILPDPTPEQLYITRRLIELSAACVAMTENARDVLIDVYGCPPEKAIVI